MRRAARRGCSRRSATSPRPRSIASSPARSANASRPRRPSTAISGSGRSSRRSRSRRAGDGIISDGGPTVNRGCDVHPTRRGPIRRLAGLAFVLVVAMPSFGQGKGRGPAPRCGDVPAGLVVRGALDIPAFFAMPPAVDNAAPLHLGTTAARSAWSRSRSSRSFTPSATTARTTAAGPTESSAPLPRRRLAAPDSHSYRRAASLTVRRRLTAGPARRSSRRCSGSGRSGH